jgi:hypothetical protein
LEGAVIVASILMAFGIDALWDELQARDDLRDLVSLVRTDITSEIALMAERNARADTVMAKMERLIDLGAPDSALPSTDSLAVLVFASWQGSTFAPTVAALDVAVGNPVWDRIPERIQVELSEYSRGYAKEDVEIGRTALETLIDLSGDHGSLTTLTPQSTRPYSTRELDARNLASFTRDPRVQSWLVIAHAMIMDQREWRTEWVDRLERLSEELGDLVGGDEV